MLGIIIALWFFTLVVVDAIVDKVSEKREENYKENTGTRILVLGAWTLFYFAMVFKCL